jgi:hypothetical protein
MSEPDAAFFKLRIERPQLIRWLDAPVPPASKWSDWRNIGGQYYFGDVRDIKDIPDQKMADQILECDRELRPYATNRDAVRAILETAAGAPYLKRAVYHADTQDFVAGSLIYAENLDNCMVFYAVVRGAEAFLGADGYGIAVIHNYIWGAANERRTRSALRLGPGARSEFMKETERASAGGAFQGIANEMLSPAHRPPVIDELDALK